MRWYFVDCLLALAIVLRSKQREGAHLWGASVVLISMLLLSPISSKSHFIFLLLPHMVIVGYLLEAPGAVGRHPSASCRKLCRDHALVELADWSRAVGRDAEPGEHHDRDASNTYESSQAQQKISIGSWRARCWMRTIPFSRQSVGQVWKSVYDVVHGCLPSDLGAASRTRFIPESLTFRANQLADRRRRRLN